MSGDEAERVQPFGPDEKADGDDAQAERDRRAGEQHGDRDDRDQQALVQLAHVGADPPANGASRPVSSASRPASDCSASRPMPSGTAK